MGWYAHCIWQIRNPAPGRPPRKKDGAFGSRTEGENARTAAVEERRDASEPKKWPSRQDGRLKRQKRGRRSKTGAREAKIWAVQAKRPSGWLKNGRRGE